MLIGYGRVSTAEHHGVEAPASARTERYVTPWWVAGGGAIAGALLFLVAHRGIFDDGYITLSYAKTLAFHGSLSVTEFRTANTAP